MITFLDLNPACMTVVLCPQAGSDVLPPRSKRPPALHGAVSAGETGTRAGPVLLSEN